MMTRLRLFPALPGRALRDDERVSAPAIAAAMRPGPGDGTTPLPPGPRPPVSPTPALAVRTIHPGQGARVQLQERTLHRPARGSTPYTLRDAAAVARVRGATVGRAAPLSYRTTALVPVDVRRGS